MNPTPMFQWTDREELLAFVRDRAFATLFAAVADQRLVAQVPIIVDAAGACLLHLSRANPLASALPTHVVAVIHGPDAYVSPDWYVEPDQVPTWNYVSVEIEGELAPVDDATLREIVTAQSAVFESRIANKPPWTPAKMTPAVLAAKLRGIRGAQLSIATIRGTRKLSQNKPAADRDGVVKALASSPHEADRKIAALVAVPRG